MSNYYNSSYKTVPLGREGKGPTGKQIVGITENGRYYLTNYGSGSIPKAKGDRLVREGKLKKSI